MSNLRDAIRSMGSRIGKWIDTRFTTRPKRRISGIESRRNAFAKCDSAIVAEMRRHFYVSYSNGASGVASARRKIVVFRMPLATSFVALRKGCQERLASYERNREILGTSRSELGQG